VKKAPPLFILLLSAVTLYVAISWKAFQFRNPTLNDTAFITHFVDVVLWR